MATPCAEKMTGASPGGASLDFLDEYDALRLQRVHDIFVVNDLVPDIDRRAVHLQRALDDVDGAHDARAKTARRAENDAKLGFQSHLARQLS